MLKVIFLCLLTNTALASEPDWSLYNALLGDYVSAGEKDGLTVNLVDYAGLAEDQRFTTLTNQISQFDVRQLESDTETLAFYINAYNILTIKLIIDNLPLDSIRDIGNFFRGPWDITVLENADGQLTLDDIEHNIIRKLGEPRIHFAVNCASLSCPDLRLEAYEAARLDAQLEQQAQLFLQSSKGLQQEGRQVRVSRIFDWYEDDFDVLGGVENLVRHYRPDLSFQSIKANLRYNWTLNSKP